MSDFKKKIVFLFACIGVMFIIMPRTEYMTEIGEVQNLIVSRLTVDRGVVIVNRRYHFSLFDIMDYNKDSRRRVIDLEMPATLDLVGDSLTIISTNDTLRFILTDADKEYLVLLLLVKEHGK